VLIELPRGPERIGRERALLGRQLLLGEDRTRGGGILFAGFLAGIGLPFCVACSGEVVYVPLTQREWGWGHSLAACKTDPWTPSDAAPLCFVLMPFGRKTDATSG
jgi:hypothetical protein